MAKKIQRKILIYKNYFEDFYGRQTKEVRNSIDRTVGLVQELNVIPENIFRELENTEGLFEILVKTGKNTIQIFCFLDGEDVILLQIGFRKRLKNVRGFDLMKAEKLRKEYFEKKKDRQT